MSRLLVLIVLLLATALSGAADASLRASGPGGHVVICADGVAVTVALGPDGLPVAPGDAPADRSHCPDCLPLVMAGSGPEPCLAPARPASGHAAPAWPAAFPPRAPGLAALPSPRGPPDGDPA